MNTDVGIYWIQEALKAIMVLAGPILAGALVVGLIISVFQAATTIQEMTLSYVPKMAAVAIILYFFSSYMLQYIISFMQRIFAFIPIIAH
ncbi:MAG TPA: flagellar biosynthesis protein FliQ [Balneolales bacterium]|nr:flagellar biosynthesis protein FliQ [Balneolales bacterium]